MPHLYMPCDKSSHGNLYCSFVIALSLLLLRPQLCQHQRQRLMNYCYRPRVADSPEPRTTRQQTRTSCRRCASQTPPTKQHGARTTRPEPRTMPRVERGMHHEPRGWFTRTKLTRENCRIMHDFPLKPCIKPRQLSRKQFHCSIFHGCTRAEPSRFQARVIAAPALVVN